MLWNGVVLFFEQFIGRMNNNQTNNVQQSAGRQTVMTLEIPLIIYQRHSNTFVIFKEAHKLNVLAASILISVMFSCQI